MRWIKKGLIFSIENPSDWMAHHACLPIAEHVSESVLRIYYGPRDTSGRTRVTFIEVEADDPAKILYVHDRPVLDLGKLGAFDDSGVMPSCIINKDGKKYLFYVGWNRGGTVAYRNAIGVTVSEDGGLTFNRMFDGPVIDRTPSEAYFCASAFAMLDDDARWKLWYTSSTGWSVANGKPEPLYKIKYAESNDSINWTRQNITCIDYAFEGEAITRPCVIKENGCYRMWYCFRGTDDYRTNKENSYRIGYAESRDGISWTRKDDQVGISRSEEGWDSRMIEYPFVYQHRGRKYMLYNGNGFGETGFGYAVEDD